MACVIAVLTADRLKGEEPMAVDETLRMDHEQVRELGLKVGDLAVGLEAVQRYATEEDLKQEHFGGHGSAPGAYKAFHDAVTALAAGVTKAHDFLVAASDKLVESAEMGKETDVDSAWGITKSGKGV